jgi:hypothetical protein
MHSKISEFDKVKHKAALDLFQDKLMQWGYEFITPLKHVTIDPKYVAGMYDFYHIRPASDASGKQFIGNELDVVIRIDKSNLIAHFEDDTSLVVKIGRPTKKGYKSKEAEFEQFTVNQNFHLTTRALDQMSGFVHDFKIWGGR